MKVIELVLAMSHMHRQYLLKMSKNTRSTNMFDVLSGLYVEKGGSSI